MSVIRFISRTAAAALIAAAIPAVAHAQSKKTACNDGTTTTATGANACDGHGGIHRVNSAILNKGPSRTAKTPTEPARVSQAGTPAAKRDEKPHYEERRGWRWGRHHEKKHEERREEKPRRVRCRDGKYENVPPGKAKGHEVCKHHGGVR